MMKTEFPGIDHPTRPSKLACARVARNRWRKLEESELINRPEVAVKFPISRSEVVAHRARIEDARTFNVPDRHNDDDDDDDDRNNDDAQ